MFWWTSELWALIVVSSYTSKPIIKSSFLHDNSMFQHDILLTRLLPRGRIRKRKGWLLNFIVIHEYMAINIMATFWKGECLLTGSWAMKNTAHMQSYDNTLGLLRRCIAQSIICASMIFSRVSCWNWSHMTDVCRRWWILGCDDVSWRLCWRASPDIDQP